MAGPEEMPISMRRKGREVFIIYNSRVIRLQIVVNDIIAVLDRIRIELELCITRGEYRERSGGFESLQYRGVVGGQSLLAGMILEDRGQKKT